MKWRNSIFLGILLILLGSWYYYYEIVGEKKREDIEIQSKRLFPELRADYIQKLKVTRHVTLPKGFDTPVEDSELEFKKENGHWQMTAPLQTAADQNVISNLVEKFVNLKSDRAISIHDNDLTAFGLDRPAFSITLTAFPDSGQAEETRFLLGNENPTKAFFYTQVEGKPDLQLTASSMKDELSKNVFYYREKRLFTLQSRELNQIKIEFASDPAIELKRTDDGWRMIQPIDAVGDTARIDEFVSKFTAAKVKNYIREEKSDLTEYGLDLPQVSLSIGSDDGFQVLKIGKESDASGKLLFATRDMMPSIFTISSDLISNLSSDPFFFRSKDICEFDREKVMQIDFSECLKPFSLKRAESAGWQIDQRADYPVDETAVGGFLSDLSYMRATKIRPDRPDPWNVSGKIVLRGERENDVLLEITVGSLSEDGAGRWVQTNQSAEFFRLSESDLDRIFKTEFDFRKKELLNAYRDDVEQIDMEIQGKSLHFKPSGDQWKQIDSDGASVKSDILDGLFWSIRTVRMTGIVSEHPDSLVEYGLDKPGISIKIRMKDSMQGPLLLGGTHDGKQEIYAKLDGSDPVYTVSTASLKSLLEFKWPEEKTNE